MKIIRIFRKNISDSFKGVFRNFSLSLASISCITITLLLVGFSIILSYNINDITTSIEKDVTIVVFIDRDASSEEESFIIDSIESLDNIALKSNGDKDVTFVSRNETKEEMQSESEVFNSIMDGYNDETNPLKDSILVKVENIELIGKTADEIKSINKVNLVKYGEGTVEYLIELFNIVKKVCIIVVASLILVTAFLISNTIKITIQSRSREIEIMRLVGASNFYIRQPFFFEGIILGIMGSIIPIGGLCYGYSFLYDKLGGKLFSDIFKLVKPSVILYQTSIVVFVVAVVVGAFGSYRAVRKYLKI